MVCEYFSTVKGGKIQRSTSVAIGNELSFFEGKRVRILIERSSGKRSIPQNSYLHLLFTIFKNELNNLGNEFTMDEVKEMCIHKCSVETEVINKNTGELMFMRKKRTSELSKTEMSDFIESIIRWGADMFNIILPYPNEQIKADITFNP